MIHIGNVEIQQTAALAPMAGVADRAFRQLCKEYGACYLVGEMVSAKGLMQGSKKSAQLLRSDEMEHPCAVQLFGNEPESMAAAVELAMDYAPDIIDINMGCPAPKIAGNGGGSALMRDMPLAAEIITAVKKASPVPVTVKFRKGWDDANLNGLEFAKMAEACGADAITIHGRTRAQMYAPPIDWDIIAAIKAAVRIPVIGNGDVTSPETAKALYEHTGCDLIMVGRAALGTPWLFGQIADYLQTGSYAPTPAIEERMAVMLRHMELLTRYKGENIGMREARKHCGWYLNGFRGAATLRRAAGEISTLEDAKRLAEQAVAQEREIE
ncbi:MAG: tRNA dihydrouridine synthase DusB [Angelakisella sp.]